MLRHPARGRAFSLIELLVVIAVISLLLSILVPSLRRARSTAARVACLHNLRQLGLSIDMYATDNDSVYPCAQDPVSTDPPYWLWMGRGFRRWIEPYLSSIVDPTNPSVLLCPADATDPAKYESTSYAYSMAFYHSPAQIDAMDEPADSYSNPVPSIPQRLGSVTSPAAKILLGEWLSNHVPVEGDTGWWCWKGARCFLTADGRAAFVDANDIRPAGDNLPDANLTVQGIQGRDLDF